MTTIRNIAIAGASGDLGAPVLTALIESGLFNITVLSRHSSKAEFPSSVKVVRVDYESVPEIVEAVKGQDAVVSTLTTGAMDTQLSLIQASITGGVKRFIPSEFSGNIGNPKSAALPVYQPKIAVHNHLKEQAKAHPGFTYTLIRNGVFLDWGLAYGFHLAFASPTPPFYDGGHRPFSTSTLATVGKAVVGVLKKPSETQNRVVYVHDLVVTQRKVLELAQKILPDRKWDPVTISTADLEAQSAQKYARGIIDMESSMGYLARAVFAEGYGGEFDQVDNDILGVPLKDEVYLEEQVRAAVTKALPQ